MQKLLKVNANGGLSFGSSVITLVIPRVTITILDIIHRPFFYLKHDVWETGFCLRLQVERTQLGQIDRASFWGRPRVLFSG
jgi:hypothetical protein